MTKVNIDKRLMSFVSVGGKRGLRKVSKTEVKDTVINSDTPELNDFLSAFEVTV